MATGDVQQEGKYNNLWFLEDCIHIRFNQKKRRNFFNVSRWQDFRTHAGLVHNFAELLSLIWSAPGLGCLDYKSETGKILRVRGYSDNVEDN